MTFQNYKIFLIESH